MIDPLHNINSREIFNLSGLEKIKLGSLEVGHTSLATIKDWVLEDLKKDLGITEINNTPDSGKPLSKAQQLYIDGQISNITSEVSSIRRLISTLETQIGVLERQVEILKTQ